MRKHYVITVLIKEVTHENGPTVYDNVKRQNVPTKGERTIEDIVSLNIKADTLSNAIAKASSHLWAENPDLGNDDEETVKPPKSAEEQAFIDNLNKAPKSVQIIDGLNMGRG